MQADHHHSSPMGALVVELIKLVFECLLVGVGIPTFERVSNDVIHVQGVWDGHEIAPAHRDNERFVVTRLVNVIEETKILQCLKDVN